MLLTNRIRSSVFLLTLRFSSSWILVRRRTLARSRRSLSISLIARLTGRIRLSRSSDAISDASSSNGNLTCLRSSDHPRPSHEPQDLGLLLDVASEEEPNLVNGQVARQSRDSGDRLVHGRSTQRRRSLLELGFQRFLDAGHLVVGRS